METCLLSCCLLPAPVLGIAVPHGVPDHRCAHNSGAARCFYRTARLLSSYAGLALLLAVVTKPKHARGLFTRRSRPLGGALRGIPCRLPPAHTAHSLAGTAGMNTRQHHMLRELALLAEEWRTLPRAANNKTAPLTQGARQDRCAWDIFTFLLLFRGRIHLLSPPITCAWRGDTAG